MLKLVLFDMDGVVFQGKNFWLDFHRLMGTEKQAWQLWEGLANTEYRRLSRLTARNLWRGRPAASFVQMVEARAPVSGIDQVFAYLRDAGVATALVSTGPYQLAQRAQRLFGVDAIRANRLEIGADGRFTGEVEVQVDDNEKAETAHALMAQFGARRETTAVIGDASSDAAMAMLVSLAIAYDSDDELLLAVSSHRLAAGQMAAAVDLLRARAQPP